MLVQRDALLEKSPAAVDDLRAGVGVEGQLLGTGQLVGHDLHVAR